MVAAVIAIAGCGGGSSNEKTGGISQLRVAVGNGSSIDSMNPLVTSCFFCQAAFRMMYPYLVEYDLGGTKVEGDFATKFTPNADSTQWTFTTRPGAKWSDGRPLTAADAAWTFTTLSKYKDSAGALFTTALEGISSATAPDANTVVVKYDKPTGTALSNLAQVPILPQHVWEPMATGDGKKLTTFANSSPVTAGPYRLAKAAKDQYALFSAYPGFYGPKPRLKSFGFQFFKSEDAVVNAVRSHQVDAAMDVTTSAVQQLKSNSNLKVESQAGMDTMLLEINSSKYQKEHRELQKEQVREAFDLALDRAKLVEVAQNGLGTPTRALIPPALKVWTDGSLGKPQLDAAKANEILDGLGYRKGSDGIRVADGHPMSYRFPYPSSDDPRLIDIIVKSFASIGVKVTPVGQDISSWIAGVQGDKYAKFDLTLIDYGPTYDPSPQLSLATCGQLGGINMSGYCSDEYDKLFARQLTEANAQRRATVNAMQQLIAKDRPIIPLYSRDTVTVRWNDVDIPLSGPLIVNYQSKDWLLAPGAKD
jgi:peptide/nickel transport system substrate-binding protein